MATPESLSWKRIHTVTKEVLAADSSRSWGEFKSEVAKHLKVPVEYLRPWKTEMKEVIAEGMKEESDGNDEEDANSSSEHHGGSDDEGSEEDEGDESDSSKRCGRTSIKAGDEGDSQAMKALRQMSRAMNLG